jgi:hypothetical protein
MKTLFALLLLCPLAYADGPKFSIWHIDGHGQQWQRDQIDAGLPLEPSIRMVASELRLIPKQVTNLDAAAPLLSQLDGGPLVLRMNNITGEIDKTIPRFALTEDNWQTSVMSVKRVAGVLDQTPVPDPFGPVCQWAECGRLWATSPWMIRLQQIIPNPTSVILRENNEGARSKFKFLHNTQTITEKIDGVKVTRIVLVWKPRPELELQSIRIADWVDARRQLDPAICESEFTAAEIERYHALFAAFAAELSAGWQGKLRTVGYGGLSETYPHDTSSDPFYPGWYTDPILTSPAHETRLASLKTTWRAWHELSITLMPSAVTAGAMAGLHDPVDPESCAGFYTAVAWRMQAPGKAVRMVWWDNYNTPPGFVLTSPKPAVQAELVSLGREDLLTATVGDYELALLGQLARIQNHPVINRFWREGTTTVLASPLNDAIANRVYATATSVPGETRKLLYVYSPCTLGEIPVGEWTVPHEGYWLTPIGLEAVE